MKDWFKNGVFTKILNVEGSAPKELSDFLHQLNNWPDSVRLAKEAVKLIKNQYSHSPFVNFAYVSYNEGDLKAVKFERAVSSMRGSNFKETTDNYYAFFDAGEVCMEFNKGWMINEEGDRVSFRDSYGGTEFVNPYGKLVDKLNLS